MSGISQSAASQVVLQLERRLGVQLIDRSTRPLQLTPAGQVFHEGACVLLERYEVLEESIRKFPAGGSPTVQVAAIYSVGLRDMHQYIKRFEELVPSGTVHIEYLHPDRVYERVLERRVDFGLISYPRKLRELVVIPWREEEMFLACTPSHRLATRSSIRVSDLQGERYVGFDRDLVIRRHVDRFLKQHRVSVNVILEFDNIENIKKAIEESGAVALLPEPMLRKEVKAGLLAAIPLENDTLIRPLGIIYRRSEPLTRAAHTFVELLKQPEGHVDKARPQVLDRQEA